MPLRQVNDAEGVRWDVWDVYPCLLERRSHRERRSTERETPARRVPGTPRPEQDYQDGWLVFRSGMDRRRLPTVPAGWETLPAGALLELLGLASITGRRPRSLRPPAMPPAPLTQHVEPC